MSERMVIKTDDRFVNVNRAIAEAELRLIDEEWKNLPDDKLVFLYRNQLEDLYAARSRGDVVLPLF